MQSCEIKKEDIISIDQRIFKFFLSKKWDGQCPDRIKRKVMKNSYENGGIKAPDTGALNKALKSHSGFLLYTLKFL